jgi:integrase
VGKRDYALLLLYITTGMRRNEVISLRGKEVTVEEKRIIIRGRVKGGDYQGREVTDRRVRAALLDFIQPFSLTFAALPALDSGGACNRLSQKAVT